MKNMILTLIIAASSLSAFSAVAGDGPCKQVKAACESGGYTKGGHKTGKGLYKDCMQKVMAGQSVPGVTVGADVVSACQAKKAKKGAVPAPAKAS